MGNVLRVFKRDILRLLKVPAALVVVVALLVLPSLYTWYNVVGFWNPYDNTGNLRVYVVNEDAGASSELTGELHVGDLIVEKLQENEQLDWTFADRDEALERLRTGEAYATFIIPKDFTERLLTLTTGDFQQPSIEYHVNEKNGPVAPKITDTGASTLEGTVNSTFVSTVSDVAADAIDQAIDASRVSVDESRTRALSEVAGAVDAVGEARDALANASAAADRALEKADGSKGSLEHARTVIADANDALQTVSGLTAQMQESLANLSAVAAPAVSQSILAVSQASTKAHAAVGDAVAAAGEARADIDASIAHARIIVDENRQLAGYLRDLAATMPDDDPSKAQLVTLADAVDARADEAQKTLDGLTSLGAEAQGFSEAVAQASDAFDAAVQQAADDASVYSNGLFGTTVPAVNKSLGELSAAAAALGTAVSNQNLLVDQASLVLDQLLSTLSTSKEALGQTDGLLAELEQSLDTARSDVLALGGSDAFAKLFGENGLDAAKVADFMGSPTRLVTEQLYELNAYGSAMAPLFMNLTFWIGAFMLLVIMRQEVDSEGIRNLTVAQRYLGRFLLLACFAVIQALVCCAGVLALGVQAASVPALFFAAAVASLAYLSIIYALSVTLQHIGKGLCIVLVFAQIPGATGLYPIEMTAGFFQAVYPYLPFTYGIAAMREAICGFYGSQYANALWMLALFFVGFMAFGLIVRPLMANVNRMVAGQVRESGLFNGEDVEIPARPYRFSQLFRALAGKDEYREEITQRYERFSRWYPRLIRGSVALGLSVPVALTIFFALTPTEKVWLLTAWLVWMVAVFVFLVVVESLRASFERQLVLDDLTNEGLLELGIARNEMERAADGEPAVAKGGEGRG
ncbi:MULTISPECIES: YhgE/Pip domain-containing protein [Gordonibacter]|uniref:YhgE/Pip domain-containing protein n=1 Tax=Gordonibacter faecis TaxID=3047475 RepID=A0ABT7DRJ9_9ACTN|nr:MULTISPECIES: YhgE/Pip domain-containing protein [unclassified Gordonibacter]MDJ1650810.1 YhgE/Pip domain-containing protein [Gordonibacter sp. KGMB12511]HIW77160.1 YhgE/Pip domain-containing protein [Candidatus Gordonibacter avicola]